MGACGCTPADGHAALLSQPAGGIQSAPTAAAALAMRGGGCCRFWNPGCEPAGCTAMVPAWRA